MFVVKPNAISLRVKEALDDDDGDIFRYTMLENS